MKKILLLLVFTLTFVLANAQKVKVVENFEEDGIKYTRLSSKILLCKNNVFSPVVSQTLLALTSNDTTKYFIEVPAFDLTTENLIVKLLNDSIIELPFFRKDVIDLGTDISSTTIYNKFSKHFETHTTVRKNKDETALYYISQENMSLMCDIGIEKQRFILKKKIVDLPSIKDQTTNYYKEGVQMIKEAQSSYSKYKDL